MVGLEIEMLPIDPSSPLAPGVPGIVKLQGPGRTSAAVLKDLATRQGWKTRTTDSGEGHTLLLDVGLDSEDEITFEPGGQVEFSSKPYPCLGDAVRRMRDVQDKIDRAYEERGLRMTQVGINPWHTVAELGLEMPKPRYRAMDRYYAQIGPYGQRMMRQTCTVQVNLDFGPDEATLAKRYFASLLLAPIATATFAFSPLVDRKLTGVPGFRSRVWRHVDPTHTGLPGLARLGETLTREACVETYLDFALQAAVVFVEQANWRVPEQPVAFGDWLKTPLFGVRPTLADFKTHLSLLFSETRPRGFFEIRAIDCQARAFQSVPAAYATGLLYEPRALDRLIQLLQPRLAELPALLARSESGLSDPTLAALARQVMDIAMDGFGRLSACYKSEGIASDLALFRERFTEQERTPADDVLDAVSRSGESFLTYDALHALEQQWAELKK